MPKNKFVFVFDFFLATTQMPRILESHLKKPSFNPDTANAVIIILIVLVHIYARFYGVSLSEAVQSEKKNMKHLTNYLLRFHNNHGNTCMIHEVHAALVEHYCEDDADDTRCEQTTSLLCAVHFIVNIFNAYLSIEAKEKDKRMSVWKKRNVSKKWQTKYKRLFV